MREREHTVYERERRSLLLKGVGSCSPPGEEYREADGLKDLGEDANADGLHGTLLDEDLVEELGQLSVFKVKRGGRKTYGGSVAGHKDQSAEIGGALVAQRARGVDEGTHAVGLQTRPEE